MPNKSKVKRNILYYPTINIPTQDWLKNAVLYWDEVSSIVPRDWKMDFNIKISNDIEMLMDKGLFRAIHPELFLENSDATEMVEDMTKEFISIYQSSFFKDLIKKRRNSYFGVHEVKFSKAQLVGKGSRLHSDKTNYRIAKFLEKEKLAYKEQEFGKWYRVESTTALLYMSLLAKYIAANDSEHTVVGTDLQVYEKLNFYQTKSGEGMHVMNCNFRGLIPSPARTTKMIDIVKFKKKRGANINNFRRFIFDIQKELSKASSNEEVKDILATGQEDLKRGIEDLRAVFKDSNIEMVLKSLKSIVNVQSSTFITGGAMLLSEKYKISGLPNWVQATALAAAVAIDVSSGVIENRNLRNEYERNSSFSYLFRAQRAGLVN